MTTVQISVPGSRRPLRLWPGVVAVALQWGIRFVLPVVVPGSDGLAIVAGAAAGVVVLVWWLFFSRAPWLERVGAIALMLAAVLGTYRIVHVSIANGMMGMMLPIFVIPLLSLALVASAAAGWRMSTGLRRASMAGAILLACGVMTLVRTAGVSGDGGSDLHWRWTRTPEERLLAQAGDTSFDVARDRPLDSARDRPAASSAPETVATPGKPIAAAPERTATSKPAVPTATARAPAKIPSTGDWPGFRGPARDGVVRGVQIETDWSSKPPVALWRRAIGPGWSSFAVHGDLFYTQEQRGDHEVVSCYRLTSGEPVWRHSDAVRFYESNGGPGPRGTPTVQNGRVYTMGATGLVNALDAGTGAVVWSRNAATDTGAQIPGWGFAGSPLLLDDLAIVAASGRLVAYDVATGQPRWVRQTRGGGYSSPHFVTIDGVAQIVLLSGGGATGVAPSDGALLWEHSWQEGVGIVQPALTAEHDVLIAAGDAMGGLGLRRLAVTHKSNAWAVEERWTSRGLKPYFNDFVLHKGHAFGFDGSILSCIDLADGTRKWKGGRYGHGQLVLLADQDVLLVLSEDGELALVGAAPDRFTELARLPALEGKTWNHPVFVGNILLVRNGEEMAAYRLPLAGR